MAIELYSTEDPPSIIISTAADVIISTKDLTLGAGTRLPLPSTKVRRFSYVFWCPNCGTTSQRDGRLGSLNHPGYCDTHCHTGYRQRRIARSLNSARNRDSILFDITSVPPGPVS